MLLASEKKRRYSGMEGSRERHTLGGIFSIIAGFIGILGALVLILIVILFGFVVNSGTNSEDFSQTDSSVFTALLVFYGIAGLVYIALGILGIVGGVFSLQKKHWGVALAGAISGAITLFPCGIAAIIFVTLAKPEFSLQKQMESPFIQPNIQAG
jgi:ABC-type sulfate transport system permease component